MKLMTALFASFIVFVFFLFVSQQALASEGIIQMQGNTGRGERCFAMSLLIQNYSYQILVNCRNLVYPIESTQSAYVVWGIPIQTTGTPAGNNPIRLGELGFGKVLLRSTYPFLSLFVTAEPSTFTRTPSGPIIMQGNVEQISFLEGGAAIQPTPLPSKAPVIIPTPIPKPGSVVSGVLRAVLIFGIILFIIILTVIIVYFVNKSRKQAF